MQKGLLFWPATRLATYCPPLPGEYKQVQPIPEPDPVRSSPSPSQTLTLPPLWVASFSVVQLFLDKRDGGGGGSSDLISQWELFALEATSTNAN